MGAGPTAWRRTDRGRGRLPGPSRPLRTSLDQVHLLTSSPSLPWPQPSAEVTRETSTAGGPGPSLSTVLLSSCTEGWGWKSSHPPPHVSPERCGLGSPLSQLLPPPPPPFRYSEPLPSCPYPDVSRIWKSVTVQLSPPVQIF